MQSILKYKLVIAGLLLALTGAVQAQALFVARKAIGRIEQLTQTSPPSASSAGASYAVASVIIDVAPDRVFAATLRLLGENRQLRVTRSDEARRSIEFAKGNQTGGIQVSELNENLSQLLVSTAHSGASEMDSQAIVTHILDICGQLKVVCERPPT